MVLNGATVRNGFKARNPFLSVSCPSEDEKHRETTGINKHENPYYLSFFGDSSWSAESSEGFPKPGVPGSNPGEGASDSPGTSREMSVSADPLYHLARGLSTR